MKYQKALTLLVLFSASNVVFGDPVWIPIPGDKRLTPALPDTVARYDLFNFDVNSGDWDYLELKGQYPYARYFSIIVYDDTYTDTDSLFDQEILPDEGNVNPFLEGVDRSVDQRDYTITVVKSGKTPPAGANNVVVLPGESSWTGIMYRIYRPDSGGNKRGDVRLPDVIALKSDGGEAEMPERGSTSDSASVVESFGVVARVRDSLESVDTGNLVPFIRIPDSGVFPNSNNEYIVGYLPTDYRNKVVVVEITPPTFENTFLGGSFAGGKDVRYWSFCVGGDLTSTTNCLVDDEASVNAEGKVKVCVGSKIAKQIARNKGCNFIEYGTVYNPLLVHRHMLASDSFVGSISNVPKIDLEASIDEDYINEFRADNFMGDYGPLGEVYTLSEFLKM